MRCHLVDQALIACCAIALVAPGLVGCADQTPATHRDHVATLPTSGAQVDAARRQARIDDLKSDLRRLRENRQRDIAAAAATKRRVTGAPTTAVSTSVPTPTIVQRPIPFGAAREREMAAYAQRHYGIADYHLRHPKAIVEHYTAGPTAASAIATFTPDVADSELHELPGVCAHFVIDRDGTIYQLVPVAIMCRHTVGLNYTAIGIEHAGFSDQDVLNNPRQLASSLALTRWLRCRYGIPVANIIGHNESLSSPYHHELVASLRTQTHGDWTRADMNIYRSKLGALGCSR